VEVEDTKSKFIKQFKIHFEPHKEFTISRLRKTYFLIFFNFFNKK